MDHKRFERLFLPLLGAAYNLARYLLRDEAQAEDIVQDAYLRAYKASGRFTDDNAKSWFLTIVRNCCFTFYNQNHAVRGAISFDEDQHGPEQVIPLYHESAAVSPEILMMQVDEQERVHKAIENLPVTFREVLILREFDELSYREIADVVNIPTGTVMSRLSRARSHLQQLLYAEMDREDCDGM
jgi:RNA polymerase sigma-70 factor (ECF subfamily)